MMDLSSNRSNINYCVMILAVGNISYKKDASEILSHYFTRHNIPYHFIESVPANINTRNAHPSWWKLLAHSILPGYDYIICWDLDLLPRNPDIQILEAFDISSLCLSWDSHAKKYPNDRFLPSFKYNGGLIGIPKLSSPFLENIFDMFAPGRYPSYEQYYLNEEISKQNIYIHELPSDINVLFSFSDFPTARLQHYTYTHTAKSHIRSHYETYFLKNIAMYDTRIDMISALCPSGGNICEVGIFKGDMAKKLESIIKPSVFVLIDLFEGRMGSGDQDGNNMEYVDLSVQFNSLKEYFYGNTNIILQKGDSVDRMNTYPDAFFDMIYIDGDHSYEGCKRDLLTAFKKIKKGGYIMGHDYEMNMKKAHKQYFFGVKKAVDEFCATYNQRILAKGNDGCVSYAIKIE